MKRILHQRGSQSGSVLVVSLAIGLVLGISLASYLLLMSHQNRMVDRGQAWNQALSLAESGVEDALAHLNRTFGTNNTRGGVNGWVGLSLGPASLGSPRSLPGAGKSYTATISAGMPVITTSGRVSVPGSSSVIERRIRVLTTTTPAFRAAMAAKRDITFSGNNIRVDSYDSGDPAHCTPNGLYDPATAKAGGDIASTEGFINVGNADVKGKLYTGPINDGLYGVGSGGSVGDLFWSGPGIQPGWYFNDFNMDFSPVDEPYPATSGLPPTGEGTNFWVLGNGQYSCGNLSVNSDKTILIKGDAVLYATGNFDMKGQILIEPGASLKLYVRGSYARLNQVNTTGNAFSFQYYGLPSNLSLSWGGNDNYVGTVYAPQAALKLGGGGNDYYDYQGSCVVESVHLNGHFKFHYDENLRRRGPKSGYEVSSWEEL